MMARLTLYTRFFYLLLRTTTSAYIYSSRIYIPEFRPHDAARLVGAQSCIPMNSAEADICLLWRLGISYFRN